MSVVWGTLLLTFSAVDQMDALSDAFAESKAAAPVVPPRVDQAGFAAHPCDERGAVDEATTGADDRGGALTPSREGVGEVLDQLTQVGDLPAGPRPSRIHLVAGTNHPDRRDASLQRSPDVTC